MPEKYPVQHKNCPIQANLFPVKGKEIPCYGVQGIVRNPLSSFVDWHQRLP